MTRLLIADDHPIVLEGLAALFSGSACQVTAKCRSGPEVLHALEEQHFDVIVLDVNMPPPDGLAILGKLKSEGCPAKVVLLTSSLSDGQILEAVQLGADGIVLKESAAQQLVSCISSVVGGDRWFDAEVARRAVGEAVSHKRRTTTRALLSPRERDIVRLAASGHRNREIAQKLGIGEGTVRFYLHEIYKKLDVSSRVELANTAREKRLLDD